MSTRQINKWLVLTIMCLLTVMLNIDATAVNLAIPVISHEFHAQLSTMQWVAGIFLLGSASFQIIGGRVGDVIGHVKLFNLATLLFVVSSALCGFAHESGLLLTGRALQGIALGIANPLSLAIVFGVFPEEQHGTAMGFLIGVMGLSLAVGPTIGGALVEYASWHWIFFVNLPIGIVTLLLSWRYCPADTKLGKFKDIDFFGALLLIASITMIIVSFNQVQEWGFDSGLFIGILAGGVVLLLVLMRMSRRSAQPIMHFELFKIKNFSYYNIVRSMSQIVFLSLLFFLPIYLVNIAEEAALNSGVTMLALTVIIGVCSPFAGKWVDKVGAKIPTIISYVFMLVGCYLLTLLTVNPQTEILYPALILVGIGIGINFTSTTTGGLSGIPKDKVGVATGAYFTVIWTSCAFAIAFAGTVVALVSHAVLMPQLATHTVSYSPSQADLLLRAARGLVPISSLSHFFLPQYYASVAQAAQHAFIMALHALGWALFIVSAIGFVGSLPVRDIKPGSLPEEPVM